MSKIVVVSGQRAVALLVGHELAIHDWKLEDLSIIIIIITIIIISFMQGIYTYIPKKNHVPREYSVLAILSLLFMVPISLVPFNAKVGRENIFKPTIGNESLLQDSNDNGVRIVNFATSKNVVVKSAMFSHRHIHKCTWTSLMGRLIRKLITY